MRSESPQSFLTMPELWLQRPQKIDQNNASFKCSRCLSDHSQGTCPELIQAKNSATILISKTINVGNIPSRRCSQSTICVPACIVSTLRNIWSNSSQSVVQNNKITTDLDEVKFCNSRPLVSLKYLTHNCYFWQDTFFYYFVCIECCQKKNQTWAFHIQLQS